VMDWKTCKIKKFVKIVAVDENLIRSLIESSENKFFSASSLKLDERTSSSVFVLYYDFSLREILEALAIAKKFKIYNHECFACFLDEILREKDFAEDFDRFRKIRNAMNYYGENIPVDDAEILIKEMNLLRKNILNKYGGIM